MLNYFNGDLADYYILWLPDNSYLKREIMIISKENMMVGIPNSSNAQYDLLFNKYLVQNDSGEYYVPFNCGKMQPPINPELTINKNQILFKLYLDETFKIILQNP